MTNFKVSQPRSALFLVLGLGLAILPACGGSQPPPAAPPTPPVAATPTPAPPPPVAAPAPAAEAPPPAPPPKHHHGHGMADLFMASLDSLELKPDQKSAVEGIESDLEKLGDASKEPRAKLEADVADGVAAGKIDHKKTDADISTLSTAVAATEPSIQDALNRLYKTLDAEQRKKLVEGMREKGKEMHEHMAEHAMMGEHEGKGSGGKEHEHEGKGPGGKEHEHEGKGPGGHEHEHEGKGPGGHEHGGMGDHEHEGMGEGPLVRLSDELALTPEQKEKLKTKLEAQMKANHAALKPKLEAAEKHMDAIGTAFEGDKFDAKKAGVGAQAPEMVKTVATQKVQFVETVLSLLTPEQRGKFAEHLKAHAGDMAEGG